MVEVERGILFENDVSKTFWRVAINTTVYTRNVVHIIKGTSKTPYELWFGHSPSIKYFRVFGRKCYITRDNDVGKFDPKSDEGMFLGYSLESKAYRFFNYRSKTIVKYENVRKDEKFGTKEKMIDYNFEEEDDNSRMVKKNTKIFIKTNIDLQNNV